MVLPKEEIIKQIKDALNKTIEAELDKHIDNDHRYKRFCSIMYSMPIKNKKSSRDDVIVIQLFMEKETEEVKA